MALHALHLCSGYDGFELAFKLTGLDVRTVCHVEREAHAAATLVARMEDQALDQAPIWDDLCTFDGRAWRGVVDIVTAGFPCQPWSAAGQQHGTNDDRWIWPDIARIIGDVRPGIVFLENVPGLAKGGLEIVLADLAEMGFDAEWSLLSAAAVGAPHKRERLWILAYANRHRLEGVRGAGVLDGQWQAQRHHADRCCNEILADAQGVRQLRGAGPDRCEREPSEGDRGGSAGGSPFPPAPDDAGGWVDYIAQGGPQPSVRRITDGRPEGLADALHLGGNGLVPVVAAAAFLALAQRHGTQLMAHLEIHAAGRG